MKSPLSVYKETAKKFNITDDKNSPSEVRLGFVREQATQQKQLVNRYLYDTSIAKIQLEQAQDEATKSAIRTKVNDYENNLRQLSEALEVTNQLVKELESEPEVE